MTLFGDVDSRASSAARAEGNVFAASASFETAPRISSTTGSAAAGVRVAYGHMLAAARLRLSHLQATPHQMMRCIIQAAAASCWPPAVVPAAAPEKPPRGTVQNVSQPKTSTLEQNVAANARPTGRGSEPNGTELPSRRSERRMTGIAAGLLPVALRARRAAFLTARPGRAGAAGRPARMASEAIGVTMSRAGSTNNAETLRAAAAAAAQVEEPAGEGVPRS